MAERIDVLFGMETPEDPRNIVLDEDPQQSMVTGVGVSIAKVLWLLVITRSYESG